MQFSSEGYNQTQIKSYILRNNNTFNIILGILKISLELAITTPHNHLLHIYS
jgi:hypothetical protein